MHILVHVSVYELEPCAVPQAMALPNVLMQESQMPAIQNVEYVDTVAGTGCSEVTSWVHLHRETSTMIRSCMAAQCTSWGTGRCPGAVMLPYDHVLDTSAPSNISFVVKPYIEAVCGDVSTHVLCSAVHELGYTAMPRSVVLPGGRVMDADTTARLLGLAPGQR